MPDETVSHETDAELVDGFNAVDEMDMTDDEALGEPVIADEPIDIASDPEYTPPMPAESASDPNLKLAPKTFAERTAEREARKG